MTHATQRRVAALAEQPHPDEAVAWGGIRPVRPFTIQATMDL